MRIDFVHHHRHFVDLVKLKEVFTLRHRSMFNEFDSLRAEAAFEDCLLSHFSNAANRDMDSPLEVLCID